MRSRTSRQVCAALLVGLASVRATAQAPAPGGHEAPHLRHEDSDLSKPEARPHQHEVCARPDRRGGRMKVAPRQSLILAILTTLCLDGCSGPSPTSPGTPAAPAAALADPLPSWNDGASKKAILDFVTRVTSQGNADYVPPRSASRPSTTTARCGPSTRCTSRCCSC